jgi:hypothetical protein
MAVCFCPGCTPGPCVRRVSPCSARHASRRCPSAPRAAALSAGQVVLEAALSCSCWQACAPAGCRNTQRRKPADRVRSSLRIRCARDQGRPAPASTAELLPSSSLQCPIIDLILSVVQGTFAGAEESLIVLSALGITRFSQSQRTIGRYVLYAFRA